MVLIYVTAHTICRALGKSAYRYLDVFYIYIFLHEENILWIHIRIASITLMSSGYCGETRKISINAVSMQTWALYIDMT